MVDSVSSLLPLLVFSITQSSWADQINPAPNDSPLFDWSGCYKAVGTNTVAGGQPPMSCYVPGTCDGRIDKQLRLARTPKKDCDIGIVFYIFSRQLWFITAVAGAPVKRIVVNWINGLSLECGTQAPAAAPATHADLEISSDRPTISSKGMVCGFTVYTLSEDYSFMKSFFNGSTDESPFEMFIYRSDTDAKPTQYVGYTDVVNHEFSFRLPESLDMDWSICNKDTCFVAGTCDELKNPVQLKFMDYPKKTCNQGVIIHPVSVNEWQITIYVNSDTAIVDDISFVWADETLLRCYKHRRMEREFSQIVKGIHITRHIPIDTDFTRKCTFTLVTDKNDPSVPSIKNALFTVSDKSQFSLKYSTDSGDVAFSGNVEDALRDARFDIDFSVCYGCVPACEGCFDSTRVKYKPGPCESYSCIDPADKMHVNNRFLMNNKLTCNNTNWNGEKDLVEEMRLTEEPNGIGQFEQLTRIECSKELDCQSIVPLRSTCNEMKNGTCIKIDVTKKPFDPKCGQNYVLSILIRRIDQTKKARKHVDKIELTSMKCDSSKGEWRMEFSKEQNKNWNKLKEGDLIVCLKEGTKLEDLYADKKTEIHHEKEKFPVAQVTLYALAIIFGIAIIIFIGILIITRIKTKKEEAEELPEGTPVVEPTPILTIQKMELKRKLAMFAT